MRLRPFSGTHDMAEQSDSPLWLEMRRYSGAVRSLLLFSLIISMVALTPTLFMLQTYERVMQSRNETTLVALLLIAGWAVLIWAALESVRVRILQSVAAALNGTLSRRIFDTLNRRPERFDALTRTGALSDLNAIRDFVGGTLLLQLIDLCFAPLFLVVAFAFHPLLALALVCVLVLVVGLTILHQLLVKNSVQRAQLAGMQAGEFARSVLAGSDAVRVMGMLPHARERWLGKQSEMLGWQAAAANRAQFVGDCLRFVRHAQGPLMITAGVLLYLEQQVGGGIIFAASVLSSRAISPIDGVASSWKSFWNVRTSARRIDTILREGGEEDGGKVSLPRPAGDLVVSRVSFLAPRRDNLILNDVSFRIRPGRALGVLGASGAGKSTLAKMLVGIWRPTRGTVVLDGHDLAHWDQDGLGEHIGYIPQEVDFLSATVAENIARLRPKGTFDPAEVVEAVALAGIGDVIRALPDGLNTRIGPEGHVLSGGQRQRVALARAVFGSPRLIVMDEPNSNLDALGEEELALAVSRMRERGSIVVIVTHRMNMVNVCDDVLVLHAGGVSAFGERDAIISRLNPQRPRQKLAVVHSAGG
jgi:PrtD family type I secretion system ABC transporter